MVIRGVLIVRFFVALASCWTNIIMIMKEEHQQGDIRLCSLSLLLVPIKKRFFPPTADKCVLKGGCVIVGVLFNIVFTLQYKAP